MGMRIVFEIVNGDQTIITAYQHWGANTDKALIELSNVLDIVQYFEGSDLETQAICMSFGFRKPYFEDHQKIVELGQFGIIPDEHVQYNEYLRQNPEEAYTRVEFGKQEYMFLDGIVTIDLNTRTFSFDVYQKLNNVKEFEYKNDMIYHVHRSFDDIMLFIEEHNIIKPNQSFKLNSTTGYYLKLR